MSEYDIIICQYGSYNILKIPRRLNLISYYVAGCARLRRLPRLSYHNCARARSSCRLSAHRYPPCLVVYAYLTVPVARSRIRAARRWSCSQCHLLVLTMKTVVYHREKEFRVIKSRGLCLCRQVQVYATIRATPNLPRIAPR